MRYKTKDKNIQLEDTGQIRIHNYPADSPKTFSYITRVYRQYKKDTFGWTEIEGQPIYFYDMTIEERSLACIMGMAQNALCHICKHEKFLTPIK